MCSAHQGTFNNIPVGSGYTVVCEAEVGGTIAWQGQITNQSIANGQTTTLPAISMTYIGSDATPAAPTGVSATAGAGEAYVTWTAPAGPVPYTTQPRTR